MIILRKSEVSLNYGFCKKSLLYEWTPFCKYGFNSSGKGSILPLKQTKMIYWHNNLELIWNVPNNEMQFMYAPIAADWRKRRKKILHLKWDFPSLASEAKIATISHWSQSLYEISQIWIPERLYVFFETFKKVA